MASFSLYDELPETDARSTAPLEGLNKQNVGMESNTSDESKTDIALKFRPRRPPVRSFKGVTQKRPTQQIVNNSSQGKAESEVKTATKSILETHSSVIPTLKAKTPVI